MNVGFVKGIGCICLSAYLIVANCPIHNGRPEDPSEFGFVSQTLGTTVASGATESVVRMSDWTPVTGPIATEEMRLNYLGELMEIKELLG